MSQDRGQTEEVAVPDNRGWRQIPAQPLTGAPRGCLLRMTSCPIVVPTGPTGKERTGTARPGDVFITCSHNPLVDSIARLPESLGAVSPVTQGMEWLSVKVLQAGHDFCDPGMGHSLAMSTVTWAGPGPARSYLPASQPYTSPPPASPAPLTAASLAVFIFPIWGTEGS